MIELEKELAEARSQRAFLVGFQQNDEDAAQIAAQLEELADLLRNLEIVPLEPEIVRIREPQVRYRCGTGKAEAYVDGVNAHRKASDYRRDKVSVTGTWKVHLAPGGGAVLVL